MIAPRHTTRFRRRFTVAAALWAGLLTTCAVGAEHLLTSSCACASKVEITDAAIKKMSFEVYPQWRMQPGNASKCPTAEQLGEYMATAHPKDAWGQDFIISCSPVVGGIVVRSLGPDKRFGTHDDIVSDL